MKSRSWFVAGLLCICMCLPAFGQEQSTISVFKVGHDGTLTQTGHASTLGDYPRIFVLDPSGRFMVVGNQFADNVTTFGVNQGNGSLKFTGNYTPVGSPSGMVFLI